MTENAVGPRERKATIVILTPAEASQLIEARRRGVSTLELSTDLGLSRCTVSLAEDGFQMADGSRVPWAALERLAGGEPRCYTVRDGQLHKIQVYSELLDRSYVLYPTSGAPTALNAGIPMHRVKGIDPLADIRGRLRTVLPIRGEVLDTATGMGYSAIELARRAERVVTIELDPAMVELARQNPWSRPLFELANIERRLGDSTREILKFAAGSFSLVVHDPPTIQLAGAMYSGEFYGEVHRVLQPGGRLFHYIGDLRSRLGRRVGRGAIERLRKAGFRRVEPRPPAFGIVARK